MINKKSLLLPLFIIIVCLLGVYVYTVYNKPTNQHYGSFGVRNESHYMNSNNEELVIWGSGPDELLISWSGFEVHAKDNYILRDKPIGSMDYTKEKMLKFTFQRSDTNQTSSYSSDEIYISESGEIVLERSYRKVQLIKNAEVIYEGTYDRSK